MSNVKEVANINGYPLKDKQSREQIVNIKEQIMNPQLADFVDCEVFAQVIGEKVGFDMTDFGVQSMAIGDNVLCVGITNKNAGTGEQSKLIAYNIATGSVVGYKNNLSIGHCNGMTYCTKDGNFYIACDGGQNGLNKVEVYDKSLNYVKTVNFSSYEYAHPYGIAWYEKTQSFYCIVDEARVAELDYNFKLVKYHIVRNKPHSDLTAQTIFIAEDYLFIIFNDLSHKTGNYNKMIVYNIETMNLYKEQYVMQRLELEQCAYYNNQLYLLFNSQNSGLICKGSLFNDDYTGNYIPKYLFGGSQIAVESKYDEYYMNSTYTDFFVENTEEKPFNKLLVGIGYAVRSTLKEAIRFNVTGDYSTTNIVIKHLPCNLRIEGYGDTKCKIGGVFIQNTGIATIKNLEIVKRSATQSALLGLRNVQYSWIENVDFNGTGEEQDGLWMVSSTAELISCNFKSDVTRNLIHCVLNSYLYINNDDKTKIANTFTGEGGFAVPNNIALSKEISYKNFTKNVELASVIPATTDFDITKIKRSGKYYLQSGGTSKNVPPPLKSGGYVFEVNNNNDVVEYRVRQYDGWKGRGVMTASKNNQRTIKWIGEDYINEQVYCSSVCSDTSAGLHVGTTNLKEATLFGSFKTGTSSVAKDNAIATISSDYYKPLNAECYFIGTSLSDGKSYIFYVAVDKTNNNKITLYPQSTLPASTVFCVTGTYPLADYEFTINEV